MSQNPTFRPRGNITCKTTYIASWWLPAEFGEILVGFVQDGMLLFNAHLYGVLMRIAVEASADVLVQLMTLLQVV